MEVLIFKAFIDSVNSHGKFVLIDVLKEYNKIKKNKNLKT